jgi:hypothetical protein
MGALMNRELRQTLVADLKRLNLPWQISSGQNEQEELRWIRIANLHIARIEIGLSSDAQWLRIGPHSVTRFSNGKPCVFLLPILELPFDEAFRLLERGLHAHQLSSEFLKLFPFEDVVVTGLESDSEHWTSLALKWVEQRPLSDKLMHALQMLKQNGPTQKVRHAAQKLATREIRRRE